jgi:DNA-binding NarL/FixJ family response regulator
MECKAFRTRELSKQEIVIIQMAADGETVDSTAGLLQICKQTVKNHRHLAVLKLGADNTTHAVAQALRRGLIS